MCLLGALNWQDSSLPLKTALQQQLLLASSKNARLNHLPILSFSKISKEDVINFTNGKCHKFKSNGRKE